MLDSSVLDTTGLEAIAFQHQSPFANELTAVFQNVIDYRDSLPIGTTRIAAVIKFVKEKMSPEFFKVVKKYAGFDVNALHLSKSVDLGFAIGSTIKDDYTSAASNINALGLGDANTNLDIQTVAELEKLSRLLNMQTGKMSIPDKYPMKLRVEMFFDPYSAFLAKDLIHSKVGYMTAAEIAAIELHEVGHFLSHIEICRQMYYRVEIYQQAVKSFKAKASTTEKIKYIKANQSNTGLAADKQTLIDNAIKTIDYLQEKINSTEPEGQSGIGEVTKKLLLGFLLGITNVLLVPLAICANLEIRIDNEILSDIIANDKMKVSDIRTTNRQFFMIERLADEYASRHGMSGALAGGLNKINDYWPLLMLGQNNTAMVRDSSLMYSFIRCISIFTVMEWSGGGDEPFSGVIAHENDLARMVHLLQNTIVAFKDANLSDQLVKHYIQDFEATEDALVKAHAKLANNVAVACNGCWSVLMYCASPNRIANWLINGTIQNEYSRLQTQLESIQNNKLYYQAAKLKTLTTGS